MLSECHIIISNCASDFILRKWLDYSLPNCPALQKNRVNKLLINMIGSFSHHENDDNHSLSDRQDDDLIDYD